jgi:hypothetical protein
MAGKLFNIRLEKCRLKGCKTRGEIMKTLKCSYPTASVYLKALRGVNHEIKESERKRDNAATQTV